MMEHKTRPTPYGAKPGGRWTLYEDHEGVEDSRLQEVDQKLNSKLPYREIT